MAEMLPQRDARMKIFARASADVFVYFHCCVSGRAPNNVSRPEICLRRVVRLRRCPLFSREQPSDAAGHADSLIAVDVSYWTSTAARPLDAIDPKQLSRLVGGNQSRVS